MALVPAREHCRDEGFDPVDDTPHVHAERPSPVVQLVVPHLTGCTCAHAGVVAHEVHRAERVQRGIAQRLDRREVGDVGDDAEHVETFGFQVLDCRLQRRLLDVGQHDLHALTGEAFSHRPADAAGSARDDCNLTF